MLQDFCLALAILGLVAGLGGIALAHKASRTDTP